MTTNFEKFVEFNDVLQDWKRLRDERDAEQVCFFEADHLTFCCLTKVTGNDNNHESSWSHCNGFFLWKYWLLYIFILDYLGKFLKVESFILNYHWKNRFLIFVSNVSGLGRCRRWEESAVFARSDSGDYPLTFQQQLLVLKYFQLFYLSDCGKPSRVARWCKCSSSWSSNKQRMNMNIMNIMNMNMITTLSMFIQQVTHMYVPVHSWKKTFFWQTSGGAFNAANPEWKQRNLLKSHIGTVCKKYLDSMPIAMYPTFSYL